MMKKILKVCTPLLSAVVGLLIANIFNICDYIPFVPEEYRYEICITIYFAIFDAALDDLFQFVAKKIESYKSSLEVTLHPVSVTSSTNNDTILCFNSQGLAELMVSIKIKGKKKHFEKTQLKIISPVFADIQCSYKQHGVSIIDDLCQINLFDIFGSNDYLEITHEYRLVFAIVPIDGHSEANISPQLTGANRYVTYVHNNLKLKAGE